MLIAQGDGWCMVHGDAVEELKKLGDRSVAHVITDPPYEAEAHTKQRRTRSRVDGSQWKRGKRGKRGAEVCPVSFAAIDEKTRRAVGREFARVVERWAIVFCQVEAAMLWRDAAKGLVHRRVGIWNKPDGMPQLTGDRPGMGYEAMEILHAPGKSRWNAGGKRGVWTHNTRWRPENPESYRRGGREGADDHETTKPLSLMLELVADFTDPGELIVDPFAGSGTTGVAAIRLGRQFLGVEQDERYFRLACERLAAEERGSTVQAERAGQLSLLGGSR